MQSGNLYVYCVNSPVLYFDQCGQSAVLVLTGGGQSLAMSIAAAVNPTALCCVVIIGIGIVLIEYASKTAPPASSLTAIGGTSSPASPPPDSDDEKVSSFKKYSAAEIERKYGLKKGQYHREIKKKILSDVKNSYRKQMKAVGENPDILLSPSGQIQIVSTNNTGKPFVTDLFIQWYF